MALTNSTIRSLAAAILLSSPTMASTVMIDAFDEGPFSFFNDQSRFLAKVQFGGMLGGSRWVGISNDRRRTTVTTELIPGTSQVTFDTGDGPPLGSDNGTIRFLWGSRPFLDLTGFEAFVLEVPQLQGLGEVHIGINGGGFGTSSTWVPLVTAGQLRVPMNQVDIANGSLTEVSAIQLVISGRSSDFSLSIGEFYIVPEPSVATLVFCLSLITLQRRKRGC